MRAAEAVREVARTLGVKPEQIARTWLLQKGPDIVPIPGTKRITYLEENVATASVALDAALVPEMIAGTHYTPTVMSIIER